MVGYLMPKLSRLHKDDSYKITFKYKVLSIHVWYFIGVHYMKKIGDVPTGIFILSAILFI